MEGNIKKLIEALEIIKGMKESTGEIDCPVCGNKLSYVRQHNGHVWGKCKTENCLSWIQ